MSETSFYGTHTHHTSATIHYNLFTSHRSQFTQDILRFVTVIDRDIPTFVEFNIHLIFMDPCIAVRLSRNNQQDATL